LIEIRQDEKTKQPYRVNLAITERLKDGKQRALWVDTDEADRDQMAMAKYREQMKYGAPTDAEMRRYSPAQCIGADTKVVSGDPDPKHVSTSYVERHNLTMRMGMRRFTRLTNGFSKKIENHAAMVAIHAAYYNFGRIHKTLRITPAMAAGLSDHVWSLEEIVELAK
jgi:hypothetical protein